MIQTTDARWHGETHSLTIKTGDDRPYMEAVLFADGEPLNFAEAGPIRRVVFRAWADGEDVIDNERAEVTDRENGRVHFDYRATSLPDPGAYQCDFRVVWQDGDILSFPHDDELLLAIRSR